MLNIINLITSAFKPQATVNGVSEREIRRSIRELHAMNDRELNELGVCRGEIDYAVRYGRHQDQTGRQAA